MAAPLQRIPWFLASVSSHSLQTNSACSPRKSFNVALGVRCIPHRGCNSEVKAHLCNRLRQKSPLGLNLKAISLSGFSRLGAPVLHCKRIGVAMASSDAEQIQVQKSEEEWRAILSPDQFRILRQKGTELPGTGEYNKFFEDGLYKCAGCGTPLYKSAAKFDSGCGWPAFYEGLPGAINRNMGDGLK